jgi:hypothetical protein
VNREGMSASRPTVAREHRSADRTPPVGRANRAPAATRLVPPPIVTLRTRILEGVAVLRWMVASWQRPAARAATWQQNRRQAADLPDAARPASTRDR